MNTLFNIPDKPLPKEVAITLLVICSIAWIVALIITIINWRKESDDDDSEMLPMTILVVIPMLIGLGTPIYLADKDAYDKYYKAEYHEVMYDNIYSVNRENEVSGHFALGYGHIKEESYYYFYTKVSEDIYTLDKIKTKNCYIVETDEKNYYISIDKLANSEEWHYSIYVPKGTIVQTFKA